jgi:hypothetical protein
MPDATGWRPIETAPKDGTYVLLWFPETDLPVRVGYWSRADYWYSYAGHVRRRFESGPTHWMALPAPPADVGEVA